MSSPAGRTALFNGLVEGQDVNPETQIAAMLWADHLQLGNLENRVQQLEDLNNRVQQLEAQLHHAGDAIQRERNSNAALTARVEALERATRDQVAAAAVSASRRRELVKRFRLLHFVHQDAAGHFAYLTKGLQEDDLESMLVAWGYAVNAWENKTVHSFSAFNLKLDRLSSDWKRLDGIVANHTFRLGTLTSALQPTPPPPPPERPAYAQMSYPPLNQFGRCGKHNNEYPCEMCFPGGQGSKSINGGQPANGGQSSHGGHASYGGKSRHESQSGHGGQSGYHKNSKHYDDLGDGSGEFPELNY